MQTYLFRLLCTAVLCALMLSLFPEGKAKDMIRLLAGMILTVTLLRPDFGISLPEFDRIPADYLEEGRASAAEGQAQAQQQRQGFIKEALEAYILDKAEQLGCQLSVQVILNGEGIPEQVILSGEVSGDDREELESILTEAIGIGKEEQQWNGQKRSGSFGAG